MWFSREDNKLQLCQILLILINIIDFYFFSIYILFMIKYFLFILNELKNFQE